MNAPTEQVTTKLFTFSVPKIATYWPEHGGIYAGVMRGENGAPDYLLIHATAEFETVGVSQPEAVEKAQLSVNGFSDWSAPERHEARLLAINSPDDFDKTDWYWTATQGSANTDFAWVQSFSNGGQATAASRTRAGFAPSAE